MSSDRGALRRIAIVTAAAAVALFAATFGAESAEARARFFQFNTCGNVCNDGAVASVADAIKRSILDFRPHAVGLNEVCRAQYKGVLRRLRRTGWAMRGRFVATKTRANDCPVVGGRPRFGNAVLTRNPILWARSWPLPHRDGSASAPEIRKLLCVTTSIAGFHKRVCSTHITNTGRRRKNAQIRKVTRIVTPWVRRGPVVVMGDFNVIPTNHALDRLYSPNHGGGASGRFQEADESAFHCRCGESTSGSRKIDYIFLSNRHWNAPSANATHSDVSDHDPLRGSVARRR